MAMAMDEMQFFYSCRPVAIFSPLKFRGYCDSLTDGPVLGLPLAWIILW